MRVDELKLRLNTQVNRIIDSIFPKGNLLTGIANATVKFYVEQNMYVVDNYIKPFADREGNVDTNRFLCLLESQVFTDGITSLDVLPYIEENIPEAFRGMFPDKIVINKEDIVRILSEKKRHD